MKAVERSSGSMVTCYIGSKLLEVLLTWRLEFGEDFISNLIMSAVVSPRKSDWLIRNGLKGQSLLQHKKGTIQKKWSSSSYGHSILKSQENAEKRYICENIHFHIFVDIFL
ncbi:hypothetical protein TWF751_007063 [Orbilia oligospora]|nr:hypothetical protein TWF751_007063 [Orbilia oligospora]